MINSIVFICNKVWSGTFHSVLSADFPETIITFIDNKEQLNNLSNDLLSKCRLIAFFTDIIVPKQILEKVRFQSFNFHPSTPKRPGWAPLNYALLEGDRTSGVTLSLMVEKIDAGPIIDLQSFVIDQSDDYIKANNKLFECAFALFRKHRDTLFFEKKILTPLPIQWGKHFKTQRDLFEDTVFDPRDISKTRIDQLVKAFGQTPELCLLRFKSSLDTFYYDHTKQNNEYKADVILHGHKFFKLNRAYIPFTLKSSPRFYDALVESLES